MMGKKSGYLAMRNEQVTRDLVSSDVQEFVVAANKLAIHALKLGGLLGIGTSLFLNGLPLLLQWEMFGSLAFSLLSPLFLEYIPAWLEMPGALLLQIVGAPNLFASTLRGRLASPYVLSLLVIAARAHPSLWWIQKFLHKSQWHIKLGWHYHSIGISGMGIDN